MDQYWGNKCSKATWYQVEWGKKAVSNLSFPNEITDIKNCKKNNNQTQSIPWELFWLNNKRLKKKIKNPRYYKNQFCMCNEPYTWASTGGHLRFDSL